MPNIAIVLREEVQRLAKKEVNAAFAPLKRDNIRLKKTVAELRRELAALDGQRGNSRRMPLRSNRRRRVKFQAKTA